MAVEDRRRAWFNFGRVFVRGWTSFSRSAGPALGITALTICVPIAGFLALSGGVTQYEVFWRSPEGPMLAGLIAGVILMVIIYLIGLAALLHMALAVQQGRPAQFGTSLGMGFRLFLPLLGLNILVALGTGLGLLLLIVPGLMLMVLWCVASAARVNDGAGVIAAMEESARLTRGVRWQVFAMLVLTWIGLMIIDALGGLPAIWAPTPAQLPLIVVTKALTTGVQTLVSSFGVAALFHELKWGEGYGEQTTAEVFA